MTRHRSRPRSSHSLLSTLSGWREISMSEEFDTLFKLLQNRDLTELTRIPTADEAIAKHLKKRRTRFPLRVLGWATDGEVILTEEERTHTHILGLPGQGKSKLLEFLIRGDVDNLVAG